MTSRVGVGLGFVNNNVDLSVNITKPPAKSTKYCQSTFWIGTLNDPYKVKDPGYDFDKEVWNDKGWEKVLEKLCEHKEFVYICGRREIGEKGVRHIQIYFETRRAVRPGSMHKLTDPMIIHWEPHKYGERTKMKEYCSTHPKPDLPDDLYFWEEGDWIDERKAGKKMTPLENVAKHILANPDNIKKRELCEQFGGLMINHRTGIMNYIHDLESDGSDRPWIKTWIVNRHNHTPGRKLVELCLKKDHKEDTNKEFYNYHGNWEDYNGQEILLINAGDYTVNNTNWYAISHTDSYSIPSRYVNKYAKWIYVIIRWMNDLPLDTKHFDMNHTYIL